MYSTTNKYKKWENFPFYIFLNKLKYFFGKFPYFEKMFKPQIGDFLY